MRLGCRPILALCLATLAGGPALGLADAPESGAPAYRLADGKVDAKTLNGYRRFGNSCQACHGPDAVGGSFAPALSVSLKTMEYETFLATVRAGRRGSDTSVMPSFADNAEVMRNIDDIFRYLSARAKGGLGTGRPHKIED